MVNDESTSLKFALLKVFSVTCVFLFICKNCTRHLNTVRQMLASLSGLRRKLDAQKVAGSSPDGDIFSF